MDNDDGRLKVAVGFCYFDGCESVKRAMDSFVSHVDYVIAVYGKYPDMEGDPDEYLDSKELCESYSNVISKTSHTVEHEKRNVYLEECEKLGVDVLLIIDSDEWIEGDWGVFYENLKRMLKEHPNQQIMGLKGTINRKGDYSFYPRVWVNPETIRYYHSHCVVKQGNTISHLRAKYAFEYLVDGIIVWHNDDPRDPEFISRMYQYQKKLMENEKEIRKIHK